MIYGLLADAVLVVHLGFVVFVVLGGLAVLRWPRLAFAHVPCALWGVFIEASGGICPLTPLEDHLRSLAGQAGRQGDFVERTILWALYPDGLTRGMQYSLAVFVLAVNASVYVALARRLRQRKKTGTPESTSR